MNIALTTRWNARRHIHGEAMLEEILELGFSHVELGYDLRMELVEGVQKMVAQDAINVNSLHNYCPVPMGIHRGHPEIFTFANTDPRVRKQAVSNTRKTIEFAAELGAKVVVSHSGYVPMRHKTEDLFPMLLKGKNLTSAYDKKKMKLQLERDKKVKKVLPFLYGCIEELLPSLEEHKITLALENMPTWEAVPNETEFFDLANYFGSEYVNYWHDMGHGQIRENMGFINAERWLERLEPHLAGMHVHDVAPPIYDHVMPSQGTLDFERFKRFAHLDIFKVMEPTPRTSADDIVMGLEYLKEIWK